MSMAGALDGVRVADFSWVGAGPRATKDLADNGALVIKIESRKRLDLGRLSPPFKDGKRDPDGSAFFAQTNTSKRSVTINLGEPRGVEVAKALIAWADVVVENFGKGFLERLALSYAEMKALNPDVILVSVSVAGRTGPLSGIRGYGNSAAALSGQAALCGWEGHPPHMPPFAYGDVVAPMFATVGVLAALEHRRRTGEGQHIDVSQVEPLMHALADIFLTQAALGPEQVVRGNRAVSAAPHGAYPCRGHDQWCAIACETESQWRAFQATAALPGLSDGRFATLEGRKANEAALDAIIAAWTEGQDKHELAKRLRAAGIAAGAVQDGRDVFTDPELMRSGHYVRIRHPVMGASDMPAPPMRFSGSRIEVRPAPLLGADNRAVFVDLLGMDAAYIAQLEADGVLS
jgi:benzylsuccinate CoA-transferase BbsF subunit